MQGIFDFDSGNLNGFENWRQEQDAIIEEIKKEWAVPINQYVRLKLKFSHKEVAGKLLLVEKPIKIDKTVEKDGDEIIHKGISQRSFSRSFTIADDVKVNGAELKDGLLTIDCEKIVPEQKKKKLIPIG